MKHNHSRYPIILPWLAKRARISEAQTHALWHSALDAAAHQAPADSADFYKAAVDTWIESVAREHLRQHGLHASPKPPLSYSGFCTPYGAAG